MTSETIRDSNGAPVVKLELKKHYDSAKAVEASWLDGWQTSRGSKRTACESQAEVATPNNDMEIL